MTNILLPIETIVRELDYKLVLASMLAAPHRQIIIGQHDFLHNHMVSKIYGGIYIGKTVFPSAFPQTSLARYRELKKNQLTLIHLDEEGAVFRGTEDKALHAALRNRLDPSILSDDDHVCTWGEFQREYYHRIKGSSGCQIHNTGHPRFQLLAPPYTCLHEEQSAELKRRYGDFVLVNTNFGIVNHPMGLDPFLARSYTNSTRQARVLALSCIENQYAILFRLASCLLELSEQFPKVNFVLRRHPSESSLIYKKLFERVSNIHISHAGSVIPWIFGCKAVLQNNCTTGLEASFAGKPVINLFPPQSPEQQYRLMLPIGINCMTSQEVAHQLKAVLDQEPDTEHRLLSSPLQHPDYALLQNLQGHNAFLRVTALVEEIEKMTHHKATKLSLRKLRFRGELEKLRRLAYGGVSTFSSRRRRQLETEINKFPGIDHRYVASRISKLSQIAGKPLKATFVSDRALTISVEQTEVNSQPQD